MLIVTAAAGFSTPFLRYHPLLLGCVCAVPEPSPALSLVFSSLIFSQSPIFEYFKYTFFFFLSKQLYHLLSPSFHL